jgi:diaminopimelate decarboxylase
MNAASTQLSDSALNQAARNVGTPFYAYCAETLRQRIRAVRAALPQVDFLYSMKANPNLSLVRLIAREGMGLEVCSMFEMEACLVAGVSPSRMIFVGPAKSPAEMIRALQLGLKAIVVESLGEIETLSRLCAELGLSEQAVVLRINPDFHVPGARLSMSGKPTQFGIDAADIDMALRLLANATRLRLSGLHVYMGTRILDATVVAENTRLILALAEDVMQRTGAPLNFVDIGGGWGVGYSETEQSLNLGSLKASLGPLTADWRARFPATQLVVELGRYIVAEAGVFVTAVRQVKTTRGKTFASCDGGSNCHGAAGQAASFQRNFPIRALGDHPGPITPWMVSGPLCTPTDIIAHSAPLPALRVGSLLCIDRSGAYGLTASPTQFLSFGSPAEVLFDGPTMTVIRERQELKDLLMRQNPRQLPFAAADGGTCIEPLFEEA